MIFNMLNIYYYTAVTFVIKFVLIKSEQALLFNLEKNILLEEHIYKSITKIRSYKCDIVFACPASTFEKESVGNRALIVQQTFYSEFQKIEDIVLPECNESIQPSFMINKKSGFLEIGYEIYDLKNQFGQSQFKKKRDEFLSVYPSDVDTDPKQVLVDYFTPNPETHSSENRVESFIWIPVLLIDLNINTMAPKTIEYHSDFGIHQPRKDCPTFEVGEEIYKESVDFNPYFYGNQRTILTGERKIPNPLPKRESPCEPKYGCLATHQIIPSYYMHSNFGAFATCTLMNTVPIWGSIVKQINFVNQYLYAMSQIWESNIRLRTGFFKILKPSKKYLEKIPVNKKELYLGVEKTFAVPMIVYKMVEYTMKIPLPADSTEYYYAVVVIHNDPTPDASEERICEEKDTLKGWEDIANKKLPSGLTYVCPLSVEVATKLNLDRDGNKMYGDLELNNFPIYDAKQGKKFYKNKKSEIKKKLKKLK